ncbi:LOG family protein [Frateuria aurantia]
MRKIKALCVYCGSSSGFNPAYQQAATAFGQELARRGIRLVYGGGKVGLMGAVADATLAAGGEVYGVIPRQLMEKEVGHTGLTSLEVVETMHQRKTRLFELSDAFVALPGGFGTMDEMFEMLTWAQLGLHRFPCAFLNIRGYYDLLRQSIDHMVAEGFLRSPQRDSLWYGTEPEALFEWLENYQATDVPKWIDARTVKA